MKNDIHIVSTKVLGAECAERLVAHGIHLTQHDFITTEIKLPEGLHRQELFPAVVITSETGVKAWVNLVDYLSLDRKTYPIYCLAHTTLDAARKANLPIAASAENASLLANEILKDRSVTSVTFVCSNRRRNELPDQLRKNGVRVHEVHAYTTQLTPTLIERGYDGLIFFSPSGVESFISANAIKDSVSFCIGETTAAFARQSGFASTRVAEQPTQESMVQLILSYFKITC